MKQDNMSYHLFSNEVNKSYHPLLGILHIPFHLQIQPLVHLLNQILLQMHLLNLNGSSNQANFW